LRKKNRQNAAANIKNNSSSSSPTRNQFDLHQHTPSSTTRATERPRKNIKIDPSQLNIAAIEDLLRNEDMAFDLKWTQSEKYLLNYILLLGGDMNDVKGLEDFFLN
jgi:hypothetical protein